MDHVSPAERALYSDLTRLFMSMKDTAYAQVEACIEERFRAFLREHSGGEAGTLQITLSWTLSEGADAWAIYRTDYKTLPADVGHELPGGRRCSGRHRRISRHPSLPSRAPSSARLA